MVNPAWSYVDPSRFNQEMRVLYRDGPTLLGLSCPDGTQILAASSDHRPSRPDEWRQVQKAEGYQAVIVNSEQTIADDEGTNEHSGRLLRHGNGNG